MFHLKTKKQSPLSLETTSLSIIDPIKDKHNRNNSVLSMPNLNSPMINKCRSSISDIRHSFPSTLYFHSDSKQKRKQPREIKKTRKYTKPQTFSSRFRNDLKFIERNTAELIKQIKQSQLKGNINYKALQTLTLRKSLSLFKTSSSVQNTVITTNSSNNYETIKKPVLHLNPIISKEFNFIPSEVTYSERTNRFQLNQEKLKKVHMNMYNIPLQFLTSLSTIKESEHYKSNYIKDRLNLIIDNIQFFRDEYLKGNVLMNAFDNMELQSQIKFNKSIEQLCSLCMEISKVILGEFYNSIDQILYCKIPSIKEYSHMRLDTEKEIFISNLKFICELIIYLKAINDIFDVLCKKKVKFKIKKEEFKQLEIYLSVSRLNSSAIIAKAKTYIDKYNADKTFLRKFEEDSKMRPKVIKESKDIITKLHNQTKVKEREDNVKLLRIEKALNIQRRAISEEHLQNNNKNSENNPNKINSLIHSAILTKLLKYVNKEARQKIVAERVVDRIRSQNI